MVKKQLYLPQEFSIHPISHLLVVDLSDGQARTVTAVDSLKQAGLIELSEGKIVRAVAPAAVYHVKGKEKACIVEFKEKLNPTNPEQNLSQSSYLLIRWK